MPEHDHHIEDDDGVLETRASPVVPDPDWSSLLDTERWRRLKPDDIESSGSEFLVEGWLPRQGTSVWFGAGSTGKTQLMLWKAAVIASRGENRTWLGGRVNGTGHVLVLTSEDSERHVRARIDDIVRHTLGQTGDEARETASRLHVMAFLSMTEGEYRHKNASLFANEDKAWLPTKVLEGVRRYVTDWNKRTDEDPIVGVIMDSATSMCGFDSMEGLATTNFFFYLGRLCETLGIFWSIIGHVPKSAQIHRRDTRAGAAHRLRGVVMWTTAPRLVVEVRQLLSWRDGRSRNWKSEHPALREALPETPSEDLLVVYAAKTNLKGVHSTERYLRRLGRGAFEDVTSLASHPWTDEGLEPPPPPSASLPSPSSPASAADSGTKQRNAKPATAVKRTADDYSAGTEVVVGIVRTLYPDRISGKIVAANKVHKAREAMPEGERPPGWHLVGSPYGGGNTPARLGSATWHLERLVERGWLEKRSGSFRFRDWPADDVGT